MSGSLEAAYLNKPLQQIWRFHVYSFTIKMHPRAFFYLRVFCSAAKQLNRTFDSAKHTEKVMNTTYDSSWDEGNNGLWYQKYQEWKERDWQGWLDEQLSFPFEIRREEDDGDAFFTDVASRQPFRLGHIMKALAIEDEDRNYGILIKVREGRRTACVPLCDFEVTSRSDPNFWPVREYVVWFANR